MIAISDSEYVPMLVVIAFATSHVHTFREPEPWQQLRRARRVKVFAVS